MQQQQSYLKAAAAAAVTEAASGKATVAATGDCTGAICRQQRHRLKDKTLLDTLVPTFGGTNLVCCEVRCSARLEGRRLASAGVLSEVCGLPDRAVRCQRRRQQREVTRRLVWSVSWATLRHRIPWTAFSNFRNYRRCSAHAPSLRQSARVADKTSQPLLAAGGNWNGRANWKIGIVTI